MASSVMNRTGTLSPALQESARITSATGADTTRASTRVMTSAMASPGDPISQKINDFIQSPDYGQWLKFNPLKGLTKDVIKVIDDLVGYIQDGAAFLNAVLDFILLVEGYIIAFLSIIATTLMALLRLAQELLLKLDELLKFDILGFSGAMVAYKVKDIHLGIGELRGTDFMNLTRQVVHDWENHPVAQSTMCAMMYVPFGIPLKTGRALADIDQLLAMFEADFGKKSDSKENKHKIKRLQIATEVFPILSQLTAVMDVPDNPTLAGVLVESRAKRDNRADVLRAYKARNKAKVYSFLDRCLAENVYDNKIRRSDAFKAVCVRMARSGEKSYTGGPIQKFSAWQRSNLEDPQFKIVSNDNNNFIITSIRLFFVDPTNPTDITEKIFYENYEMNAVAAIKDEAASVMGMVLDAQESGYERAFYPADPFDYNNPPAHKDYQRSVAAFDDPQKNNDFGAMSPTERIVALTCERLKSAANAPVDGAVRDAVSEMIYRKDTPKVTQTVRYTPRYSLSNRSKLTGTSFTLKDPEDAGLSKEIWGLIQKAVETDKTLAYVGVSFVPGNQVIVPRAAIDGPDNFHPPVGNLPGEVNAASSERIVMAQIVAQGPAPADAWVGFSTGSIGTQNLLEATMPNAVLNAIARARKVISDSVAILQDIIDGLMQFDSQFKALIARIRQYIAMFVKIAKDFAELLKELLSQKLPVIYLHIWKGDAERMDQLIIDAVRKEGILETTWGGVIVFGEAALVAAVLEAIKSTQEAEKLIEEQGDPLKDIKNQMKKLNDSTQDQIEQIEDKFGINQSSDSTGAKRQRDLTQEPVVTSTYKIINPDGTVSEMDYDLLLQLLTLNAEIHPAASVMSRRLSPDAVPADRGGYVYLPATSGL